MNVETNSEVQSVSDRALRNMARSVVPLEEPERVAERRAKLVPSLSAFTGAVIEERSRRRLWTMSVAAAAVVAVLAGAAVRLLHIGEPSPPAFASVHAKQGEVRVSRAGGPAGPIGTARVDLAARDRVETTDSSAEVDLGSGAIVDVDSRTELTLGPDARRGRVRDEHLQLAFGKIGVTVPKLPRGSALTIATPSATVTVHGTKFEVVVRALEGGGTATSVAVTEGRVSVESAGRAIMLGPGANWSSSPRDDAALDTAKRDPAPSVPGSKIAPASKAQSSLAGENALFRSALLARRSGNPERAREILDKLLATYPETPLSGAAKAERARAQSDVDRRHGSTDPKK